MASGRFQVQGGADRLSADADPRQGRVERGAKAVDARGASARRAMHLEGCTTSRAGEYFCLKATNLDTNLDARSALTLN